MLDIQLATVSISPQKHCISLSLPLSDATTGHAVVWYIVTIKIKNSGLFFNVDIQWNQMNNLILVIYNTNNL